MKTVKCQNTYINSHGKRVRCSRVLGFLTDMQVDILKIDPEEKMLFRCPRCQSEQRWSEVGYEGGKLYFKVLDPPPPAFGEDLKFDLLEICQQVG